MSKRQSSEQARQVLGEAEAKLDSLLRDMAPLDANGYAELVADGDVSLKAIAVMTILLEHELLHDRAYDGRHDDLLDIAKSKLE